MNMGINDDKANVSPLASSPKVAPTSGDVTVPGVPYDDAPVTDCDALAAEAAYYDQDQQDREAYLNGYPDPRRRAWWRAP